MTRDIYHIPHVFSSSYSLSVSVTRKLTYIASSLSPYSCCGIAFRLLLLLGGLMASLQVPELEKPRVTEIQVRIDCNGCVQKIKKALYGINGIYDICIDLPQQKLTVIGWADPEKLVKAIKKSRRTAAICPDQATQPAESPPEGGQPPPEAAKTSEPPPPEASPPAELPKDQPPPDNPQPTKPENPQGEANPSGSTKEIVFPFFGQQKEGDVFVINRPNNNGPRRPWFGNPFELPTPFHVNHSYNTFTPSPYVTEYFESPRKYTNYYVYGGAAGQDRHHNSQSLSRVSGNIASIFSDENPHACRIM